MPHRFDDGYGSEPFASLVANYPGPEVYPWDDFRVEWGPVFHRGRLDGTARVLVLGQDPGAHEAIARRTLVGEAGQRTQGFLAKLGIRTSYVMVNTFIYSVYGQGGGERHKDDPAIAAYRNAWLDALLVGRRVDAVVSMGRLADAAFGQWRSTESGTAVDVTYQAITHPTYPESASASGQITKAEAVRRMLGRWNEALEVLRPAICRPEVEPDPAPYGEELLPGDVAPIPEQDLPAGVPEWMRSLRAWAVRRGEDVETKRASIVVAVPRDFRTWMASRSALDVRAPSEEPEAPDEPETSLREELPPPELLEA
jgi:uracil-DNA glycosylase